MHDLEIQIRSDGCLAFTALPAELLEVAAAIFPNDPTLQRRVALMREASRARADGHPQTEELPHGAASPD